MNIKLLLTLSSLTVMTASLSALPSGLHETPEIAGDSGLIFDRIESRETQGDRVADVITGERGGAVMSESEEEVAPDAKGAADALSSERMLTLRDIIAVKRGEVEQLMDTAFRTTEYTRHPATGEISQDPSKRKEAWGRALKKLVSFNKDVEIAISGIDPNTWAGWLQLYWADAPVEKLDSDQRLAIKVAQIQSLELEAAFPAWKKSSDAFITPSEIEKTAPQEEITCWSFFGGPKTGEAEEAEDVKEGKSYLEKLEAAVAAWDQAIESFIKKMPPVLQQETSDDILLSTESSVAEGESSASFSEGFLKVIWQESLKALKQNKDFYSAAVENEKCYNYLKDGLEVYKATRNQEKFNQAVAAGKQLMENLAFEKQKAPERFQSKWDNYITTVSAMITSFEKEAATTVPESASETLPLSSGDGSGHGPATDESLVTGEPENEHSAITPQTVFIAAPAAEAAEKFKNVIQQLQTFRTPAAATATVAEEPSPSSENGRVATPVSGEKVNVGGVIVNPFSAILERTHDASALSSTVPVAPHGGEALKVDFDEDSSTLGGVTSKEESSPESTSAEVSPVPAITASAPASSQISAPLLEQQETPLASEKPKKADSRKGRNKRGKG